MAEKKVVYFTDSYNTTNPPVGVTFVDPAQTAQTEVSINKLENVVDVLDKRIKALEADVLVLKTDAAGGILETEDTITTTNITGTTVGNIDEPKSVTVISNNEPIADSVTIVGSDIEVQSMAIGSNGVLNLQVYENAE